MAQQSKPLTLSQATSTARRIVAGCLVFIIAVLLFQTFRGALTNSPVIIGTEACPYKAPTAVLAELPQLQIDSLPLEEESAPQFSVATGGFGELSPFLKNCISKGANVYKIKTPRETFGIVERAETVAEQLGFKGNYAKTSDHDLEWKASDRSLKFNKVFKRWDYQVDLSKDQDFGKHKIEGTELTLAQNALTTMRSLGIINADDSNLESKVYYMTLRNGRLVQTNSPVNAQYVQVNFYFIREALTPVERFISQGAQGENPASAVTGRTYTTKPEFGSLSVLMTNNGREFKNLFGFQYTQWELETNPPVHEIISIQEAWTKISSGEGRLMFLKKQGESVTTEYRPLKVRRFISESEKVSIGYFEDPSFFQNGEKEEFLIPIYVFEGTAEFDDGTRGEFTYFIDAIKR